MIEAVSGATFITHKMHMIVVMVTSRTFIFAERITHRIVGSWNGMNHSLFNKCLQGSVNGYTVKFSSTLMFNICMRQCTIGIEKMRQDFFSALCNAEMIFL
eukprot:TRINITY_DN2020_c0_g1_i1.p10 TRINITY_DN2020_c0_g1~~TRINITY_DN2020_c0_g1_i1.p10  ORF type:complete len:101 (-),score=3.83 TRINITY_DN2020_c0_g1_i1:3602-3904(-)